MHQNNNFDTWDCGLIPPHTAGDGAIQTISDVDDEIDSPVTKIRRQALQDAVTYLVDNAINGAGIDVRSAINIRYNMRWVDVDNVIKTAEPVAEQEIEKQKQASLRAEQAEKDFDELDCLFVGTGIRLSTSGDKFTMSNLTASQVRTISELLGE